MAKSLNNTTSQENTTNNSNSSSVSINELLSAYEKKLYSGGAEFKLRVKFNNIELPNIDYHCEKITVKSRITPDDSSSRFALDNFISKEVTMILHNVSKALLIGKVKIEIGTKIDNEYQYETIGIFNIQEIKETDKNKLTLKLRDNAVLFDINYNAKPLIDENNGKATLRQIFEDICTKCGVTHNVQSFDNETLEFGSYDSTIKARTYISYIAEQSGSIAVIDNSGVLKFVNFRNFQPKVIPLSIVEKYTLGDVYSISKVLYEDGVRTYESGDDTYDTLYIDTANPYIAKQEQITNIYNKFVGKAFQSIKTGKVLGNPTINGYDIVLIYDDYNNNILCITLGNNTLTYNGRLTMEFDTSISKEKMQQNVSRSGEATFKKWAKTEIDNINNEVNIVVGKVDTMEEKVEKVYEDIDNKISYYFLSGKPTLSNLPASEWTTDEDKEKHLGDMYYDTTNELGYTFFYDDENGYYWKEDADSTKALSKANEALATAQTKISVYYQNDAPEDANEGDIWVNTSDGNRQFILADSEWTDIQDSAILDAKTKSETAINQSLQAINDVGKLNEEFIEYQTTISTQFTQTNEAFNFKFINEILPLIEDGDNLNQEKLNTIEKYIRFVTGNIILGASDSNFSVEITNEAINFKQGDSIIAYFTNNELYIQRAIVATQLQLGDSWKFEIDSSGNLNIG